MAYTSADKTMFQCVFEGSISMQDMEIERRPYHKNCGCALHDPKGISSSNTCLHHRNISFPKKKSWTNSSLTMAASTSSNKFSSQNSLPSFHVNQECRRH